MDQIKIGKFIAEKRKEQKLTQMQLAEMLGITDRAVSKWETGKAMPDSSIMLELCDILKITVNELLCGEVITMENFKKETENNLINMVKEKEQNDKWLLALEIVIGVVAVLYYIILVLIASYVSMEEWLRITIVVGGMVPLLIAIFFCMKIEQIAGYYECKECKHRYVPTFKASCFAMHAGRTKYMRCPVCNKKSWQKKVLTKEMP